MHTGRQVRYTERVMCKKYRSDAPASIHEMMEALRDIQAIDEETMRRFDDASWMPILPLTR